MTKEKAIDILVNATFSDEWQGNEDLTTAYHMAINALEQESILDKIRAEIVDLGQRTMNDNRASGIWACRDIIDKYKA